MSAEADDDLDDLCNRLGAVLDGARVSTCLAALTLCMASIIARHPPHDGLEAVLATADRMLRDAVADLVAGRTVQ